MAIDRATLAYRSAARAAQVLPAPVIDVLAAAASSAAPWFTPSRREIAARNLQRAHGGSLDDAELQRAVRATFRSYGRYWAESFRLPTLDAARIDAGMSYQGYGHITDAIARGKGPIMAMPHLGGWEWAAFWITQVERLGLTAVVEPLEPPSLFEFFTQFRESLGMHVVPLGPSAGSEAIRAIKRGDVLCLVCDRDLDGNGVEVEFFGERTTLPAGPATLALRTGAVLLPSAFYFAEGGHHCVIRPPMKVERRDGLRADITRITQDLAREFEVLIEAAPLQWHLLQPNWPSDHDAIAAST